MTTVLGRIFLSGLIIISALQCRMVQAESAAISENLPIDVQVDLLMTELARFLKVDDNQGIIELVPRIRALDIEIPNSLYFIEARALYRTGQALSARDRLLAYLSNTGRTGRYYDQARELLLAVKQEAEIQERQKDESERLRRAEIARSAEKARMLRLREAQRILSQIGFRGAVETGNFDKPTREALAVYQIRRDLAVNGDVTDETLELLKSEIPDSDTCDAVAGYARMPQDWSMPLGQIAHQVAVPACNKALRQYPDVVRFQVQYARALLAAGRAQDARNEVTKSSLLGYPEADNLIAQMHEMGRFSVKGKPDYDEALRWYRKSADKNYPEALQSIGRFVEMGYGGFRRSSEAAIAWYQKAANLGFPPAQVKLARSYMAARNYSDALKYLNKAAETTYPNAQYALGEMYEKGRGVRKNKTVALSWYRRAANQGHSAAAQKVSRMGG